MADIRIEQGICPKCGSKNLDYGCSEPKDESIHYPYTCQDCGFDGEEVYSIEFAEHIS